MIWSVLAGAAGLVLFLLAVSYMRHWSILAVAVGALVWGVVSGGWSVLAGALGMFTALYALGLAMGVRRESSVVIYDAAGKKTVHRKARRAERTADGVNRSGENSVVGAGENTVAVIRREPGQ